MELMQRQIVFDEQVYIYIYIKKEKEKKWEHVKLLGVAIYNKANI